MNKIINDSNKPPPVDAGLAVTDTSHLQRDKVIKSFQAKHEVMLYIIEFMASLQLLLTKNPKRVMTLTDLKAQASRSRHQIAAEARHRSVSQVKEAAQKNP